MSTKDPRHEDNVENLGIMTGKIQSFGGKYNPSNPQLTVDNLINLKQQGKSVLEAVMLAMVNSKSAISARTTAFDDFENHVTRIANTVRVCGANAQTVDQVLSIVREVHGQRVSAKLSEAELAAAKEKGNEIKQVVKHNAQIKTKTSSFGKLIQYLNTVPEYNPNEEDLKIGSLTNKLNDLIAKNDSIDATETAHEIARVNRDTFLYSKGTGLVDTALAAKIYVKAAFGASSNEYLQLSSIPFANKA